MVSTIDGGALLVSPGKVIRELRGSGVSRRRLALASGISARTIGRIESNPAMDSINDFVWWQIEWGFRDLGVWFDKHHASSMIRSASPNYFSPLRYLHVHAAAVEARRQRSPVMAQELGT